MIKSRSAQHLNLCHNSRDKLYRQPFGAAPAGSTVWLALRVEQEDWSIRKVSLAYAYGLERFSVSFCPMDEQTEPAPDGQGRLFTAGLSLPLEPCLFFYWFEIDTGTEIRYYTWDRDSTPGGGQAGLVRPRWLPGEAHSPAPWQITVYEPGFSVPAWLTGAVIYQIFPDRFSRDDAFAPERFALNDQPERIFHVDWGEDVDIAGKPETGYLACDFYGGSLKGITEHLDELAALGVGVLSLNPIFAARSNHRYDTGDYERIDPLLGDEADFVALCRAAGQRGIRILLDGVFSHTGADSRYFNKYGRYPDVGAYQDALGLGRSPWSSWYALERRDGQIRYDAWWGFPELPSVNEDDLAYRAYITGPDGIVRRWLRLGGAGWRLDVSDELPDSFLRDLRRAVRAERSDAVLLGEVWEDASCKISYGRYRDFLFGRTHDLVMGYPFQQALLGWLSGQIDTDLFCCRLETIREHYPAPAFAASYNLISSHDIQRALTALSGPPDPGNREAQALLQPDPEQRLKGEALLRLAVLFQMIYPGCPVIYYGDEAGLTGYRDPFNRRTYPWGREDLVLRDFFRRFGQMRRDWPVLRRGDSRLEQTGACVILQRSLADDKPAHVLLAINRSPEAQTAAWGGRSILLPAYGWLLEADGQAIGGAP
jgi:4-alpha-glucanotransferase